MAAALLAAAAWTASASAGVEITKAEWKGDKQELTVRAEGVDGSDPLSTIYGGTVYAMTFEPDKNRWELKFKPVCYAQSVTVQSESGSVASLAVEDRDGLADGYGCTEVVCPDGDGDGFSDASCGGEDCNDADPYIYPGAAEICYDGIDQSCAGAPDLACSGSPHASLRFEDYPANCLSCHKEKALEVIDSTHYRWMGEAPDMVNGKGTLQGKLTNAVNSYCINILGDWPVCGSCHVGLGTRPDQAPADPANVDCLVCHSESYAAQRTRLPDGSLGVAAPTDAMVRSVSAPNRANCLACHAGAGGGDGVKRGDLSLATAANTNPDFDVHMNAAGADLACQDCHTFNRHKVIGKGSDLRPTDDPERGPELDCASCHTGKDGRGGHSEAKIDDHVPRVACQTCHIPVFAKTATEVHRDWTVHHDGTPADGVSGPGHPYTDKLANLVPDYRFWNRLSDNALLGDDASETYDAQIDTYPTSRPVGGVDDPENKLYPFKYKTALQPMTRFDKRLIALDTFEYLKKSGDVTAAVENGLENMGYSRAEPYDWVVTDTYQLLNHGVNPAAGALSCNECHQNPARLDFRSLGYTLNAPQSTTCLQCHGQKKDTPFEKLHTKHVEDKGFDCAWCHGFSRPERGLKVPDQPQTDSVAIDGVVYDDVGQTLTIVATSSEQPEAALSAEGFGPLDWKSWKHFYRNTFSGVAAKPEAITVLSSLGGADSLAVP